MGSCFERVQRRKKIEIDLASATPEELAQFLRTMYVEVRQKDGSFYSKASLLSFRGGIHRHLNELGRNVDIYKDAAFRAANKTLDAHLKHLKRSGFTKPTVHKDALTDADFGKLMAYFDEEVHDPVRLTEKAWFFISFHFCLRGREMQALMRTSDLEIQEENGSEVITLSTSFATKDYQGGTSGAEEVSIGRIQQPKQVDVIKLLISKLHPSSDRLFQRAKKNAKPDDQTWYTGQAIGKNTLASFMGGLSEKAKLSHHYTNHSVRATCITRLAERGAPDSIIMATSGHKSVESLKIYNRPTPQQARQTAALLDDDDDCTDVDQILALASPEQLDDLEKPGGSLDRNSIPRRAPIQPINFAGAHFTGCTFNFSSSH